MLRGNINSVRLIQPKATTKQKFQNLPPTYFFLKSYLIIVSTNQERKARKKKIQNLEDTDVGEVVKRSFWVESYTAARSISSPDLRSREELSANGKGMPCSELSN